MGGFALISNVFGGSASTPTIVNQQNNLSPSGNNSIGLKPGGNSSRNGLHASGSGEFVNSDGCSSRSKDPEMSGGEEVPSGKNRGNSLEEIQGMHAGWSDEVGGAAPKAPIDTPNKSKDKSKDSAGQPSTISPGAVEKEAADTKKNVVREVI